MMDADRSAAKRGLLFILIGVLLYTGLLGGAEALVYRHTVRNRFFAVKTARGATYDIAILGASHALPLDFADTNTRLEEGLRARIINLAMPGAGVIPNRLVLEYFLTQHRTRTVLYVLDSFIVTSRQWNEDRLTDVKLLRNAPFDPTLARLMISYAVRGQIHPVVPVQYLTGFPKINNAERFKADLHEMEGKFEKVARPSERSAKQRIAYLYPQAVRDDVVDRYTAMLTDLARLARDRGATLVVVKFPVPAYYAALLPREEELTRRILGGLHGTPFYDLTRIGNDDRFFFDTDHLNRDGVRNLLDLRLSTILRSHLAPATAPAGP